MRAVWLIARLRLKEMLQGPQSAAVYVGVPVLLLVVIGLVFSGGHPFERRTVCVVGDAGVGVAALARFPEVRLRPERDVAVARARLRTRAASAFIVRNSAGRSQITVGPRDRLLGAGLSDALAHAPVLVEEVPRWGYVHFLFPGLLTMTIVAGGLFGMGYAMARYRTNHFLKKLATTPISRGGFVAAQLGSRALIVLGQVGLMGLAARLVFDLPISVGGALWLALFAALGLVVFCGVGFLLAALIRSDATLLDAINVLMMPVVFFSEIFFSVDELPGPLALFARALPSTQLTRMIRQVVLWGDLSPGPLLVGAAILAAWAAATFALAVRTFRWTE